MKKIILKETEATYAVSEAYKSLRTNVLFSGTDKQVIALTSCAPNEGKTTVSLNLAISLAEMGKRVLLIDADLRKSVLLNHFQVESKVQGLAHFLSRQEDLINIIYETDKPNLHVIFTGPFPPNPSEMLGGKRFKDLLSAVRSVYDYVIIDTPPLGSVIDAAVIAEECDGAIIVVKQGNISYRIAKEVKEQLQKSGCQILGVIMNMVDIHESGYGYYGKYYGKLKKYGDHTK